LIPLVTVEIPDSIELPKVEPNDLVRRVHSRLLRLSNRAIQSLHAQTAYLDRASAARESRRCRRHSIKRPWPRRFQHLDRFDFQYQFSTWLYTIAFRLATDFARKEKRNPEPVPMEALEYRNSPASKRSFYRLRQPAVEDVWSVARSMLSESQFTALWLRYGEGLSIQEIAGIMKKTQARGTSAIAVGKEQNWQKDTPSHGSRTNGYSRQPNRAIMIRSVAKFLIQYSYDSEFGFDERRSIAPLVAALGTILTLSYAITNTNRCGLKTGLSAKRTSDVASGTKFQNQSASAVPVQATHPRALLQSPSCVSSFGCELGIHVVGREMARLQALLEKT